VALVTRIALFHTGGHTELGALQEALKAALGDVEIVRLFPARGRGVPMPAARSPGEPVVSQLAPRRADEGTTGADLRRQVRRLVTKHPPRGYDLVLVVDDADCQLCETKTETPEDLRYELHTQIRKAVTDGLDEAKAPQIPTCVILAREEVEAWLLADWPNTFEVEYRGQHQAVQHRLVTTLPGALRSPESIGCPMKTDRDGHEAQGCTTKVSEKIQAVVREVKPLLYSKATHGQAMLRRVNLDAAARRCPTLRADLAELRKTIAELNRRPV
jgi:hypothetical protein